MSVASEQVVESGTPGGPGNGSNGGGQGGTRSVERPIEIEINGKKYAAPAPSMTGAEIKGLAGGPMEYMLILAAESGDDRKVADDESIDLRAGMRFRILNPATFG